MNITDPMITNHHSRHPPCRRDRRKWKDGLEFQVLKSKKRAFPVKSCQGARRQQVKEPLVDGCLKCFDFKKLQLV